MTLSERNILEKYKFPGIILNVYALKYFRCTDILRTRSWSCSRSLFPCVPTTIPPGRRYSVGSTDSVAIITQSHVRECILSLIARVNLRVIIWSWSLVAITHLNRSTDWIERYFRVRPDTERERHIDHLEIFISFKGSIQNWKSSVKRLRRSIHDCARGAIYNRTRETCRIWSRLTN